LEEEPLGVANKEALIREPVLARDWEKPEEEKAWSYLQQDQQF